MTPVHVSSGCHKLPHTPALQDTLNTNLLHNTTLHTIRSTAITVDNSMLHFFWSFKDKILLLVQNSCLADFEENLQTDFV